MAIKKNDEPNGANQNLSETSFSDEVLKLAECLMPVPPTAKVKRLIDSASVETKLSEVAWKAYDSVVGLANQTTNRIFSNPSVGQVLGGSIDLMLRWQRFNTAVAGRLFGAIWPAVGLPTGSEVAAVVEAETNEDYARELHEAVRHSIANGNDAARKSSTPEIAAWSRWTGAEHMERSNDVGN